VRIAADGERVEVLDTAIDGLGENSEDETRRPALILDEISALTRVPLRLEADRLQELVDDPRNLSADLHAQVEAFVISSNISRLASTIEFRLGESIGLNLLELEGLEWQAVADQVEEKVRQVLLERLENLLGKDGQITHELETAFERLPQNDEQTRFRLLALVAQGSSTSFDPKTHRQVRQIFNRLNYVHQAGELLAARDVSTLGQDVLEHLQHAQEAVIVSRRTDQTRPAERRARRIEKHRQRRRIERHQHTADHPVIGGETMRLTPSPPCSSG